MESDRAMVEVCSLIHGELMADDDVGVTRLSVYQSTLSKLEHRRLADLGTERIYQ